MEMLHIIGFNAWDKQKQKWGESMDELLHIPLNNKFKSNSAD